MKTILVVDDKRELRQLVDTYLTGEGFRIVQAADGREALFVARAEKPDLILLDLMMPELGGYDFLRAHKQERDTPVIILTAKVEETDAVLGLELGADDFVTKPFGMRELTARVRAVLRRAERPANGDDVLRAGDLALDRGARTVTVIRTDGNKKGVDEAVSLTPSEFDLLAALMATPNRAFTRAELLAHLARDGEATYDGLERTVDVHVRNLRTKIEANPRDPHYVQTVYGVGYRFVGE